jgi:outer membrane protein assembly factor BamB
VLAEISTWSKHPPSPHSDQHAIVAHPSYDGVRNRTVFFGNDGGVCVARDLDAVGREEGPPYQRGWTGLSNSLGVTQFYGGAGNVTSGKIIGGAQDNGTLCFDPDQGPGKWTKIFGGDGGWCASDPTDPNVFYGEYIQLDIKRNTDGGTTPEGIPSDRHINGQFWNEDEREWDWKPPPFRIPDAMPQPPGQEKALFIAPFVLDPNEPNRILAGGLSLWRTNDAKTPNTTSTGPSWQAIKEPIGPSAKKFGSSALAVAMGDSDTIWVGHANGSVFRTSNGTAGSPTWKPTTSASFPPRRYCTSITVDPQDKKVVYVAFGGFERGNLWVTPDGGETWTNFSELSDTLPTAPVRAVAVHPRRRNFLYAGTEVGLYASENSGETWSPTNEGPTNCSVDDLFWMGETLVSVTHGRGMYRIDLSSV